MKKRIEISKLSIHSIMLSILALCSLIAVLLVDLDPVRTKIEFLFVFGERLSMALIKGVLTYGSFQLFAKANALAKKDISQERYKIMLLSVVTKWIIRSLLIFAALFTVFILYMIIRYVVF